MRWPLLERMARAGTEECELVGKVPIEGPARHTGLFRDGHVGRVCRPDRVVERDGGVDNAPACFILALGAAVECVLPGDLRDLQCDLIIDKRSGLGLNCHDEYTPVNREYGWRQVDMRVQE